MSARIIILTGPVHTGKSNALNQFIARKRKQGELLMGVVNPDIDSQKWFVNVLDEKKILMDAAPNETAVIEIGKYRFSQSAFARTKQLLIEQSQQKSDWFIIDEIGKLELKGKGLEPEVSVAIANAGTNAKNLILVIRDYLLEDAIEHYRLGDCRVIKTDDLDEI